VWHASVIHHILTSEVYIGRMFYGKTEHIASTKNPEVKTRWRKRPREEWIAIAVPAIIDDAIFVAAQRRRLTNAQQSARNTKREYVLSGHLFCGACGRRMYGQCDVRDGSRAYRCTRPRYLSDVLCRGSAGAQHLEATVWRAVERVLNHPELIAQEVARRHTASQRQQGDMDAERRAMTRQLARCASDLQHWETAYLDDKIDAHYFQEKKAEVDTRRASFEAELSRLESQQAALEQAAQETQALEDYCRHVAASLAAFTYAEKRLALQALGIAVTWHREKPLVIQGSISVHIVDEESQCLQSHG
jgi:site-specific DNA recombinase